MAPVSAAREWPLVALRDAPLGLAADRNFKLTVLLPVLRLCWPSSKFCCVAAHWHLAIAGESTAIVAAARAELEARATVPVRLRCVTVVRK